jgi:hypothetical protein
MDTVEAGRYHFFHHRYCSATFWEEQCGNFDGDGLFHHDVMIGDRCAATTIDHISTILYLLIGGTVGASTLILPKKKI